MKFEFSAGGIVYKKTGKGLEILVAQHSQHHGWVFPKGLIGDYKENETKKETAIREVKEETGVLGKILQPLTPITYWYVFEGQKIKKTVYYFLMEYISGDIKDHDWEMENVEWLLIDKVEKRLTYPSDKQVWKEAKQRIVNSV
ncbi:MAG: NUDIX domain-containing protein [Candidatus Levyibacteriota bacterium]|nr:MAG: NUDIX domain-containing protein [Candidatus Levybacteria bacterium]